MKFFGRIILLINWFAALCLLGAYLSQFISPANSWIFAFLGLTFPILVLVNVAFLIYWAFSFNSNIAYSAIALLIGFWHIPRFIQFGTVKTNEHNNKCINIVDFNTKNFGAYDEVKYDTSVFFSALRNLNPDIICFQEFVNFKTEIEKPIFIRLFKEYKHFFKHNVEENLEEPTGLSVSIFSRFPIVHSGFIERINGGGNYTIFADLKIDEDTIRVVNTHLKSIAFDKLDYETVEEIEENDNETDIRWYHFKHIAHKLKNAFVARSRQAEMIKNKLEKSKYKVILCGDFNDSPASYSYKTIRGKMKDAFIESGSGFSSTYIGKMPSFRIDYILCDKSFEVFNYKPSAMNFGDHLMLSATIKLK